MDDRLNKNADEATGFIESIRRSLRENKPTLSDHKSLMAQHGHSIGSRLYSRSKLVRAHHVNTKQNPVGYFKK